MPASLRLDYAEPGTKKPPDFAFPAAGSTFQMLALRVRTYSFRRGGEIKGEEIKSCRVKHLKKAVPDFLSRA